MQYNKDKSNLAKGDIVRMHNNNPHFWEREVVGSQGSRKTDGGFL